MKIIDLAHAVAPGMPLSVTGIREGEKVNELMIGAEDARHTLEFNNHYVIITEIYTHNPQLLDKFLAGRPGKKLPEDFTYASDTNTEWLGVDDLRRLVNQINFL